MVSRSRVAPFYIWGVAAVGIGLCVFTTVWAAPWRLWANSEHREVVLNAVILVILTFISSISRVETRVGSRVTVSIAPLFGAVLLLPPWAVMAVAALGTLDERVPGRGIAWDRFLFNRGMYVLACGVPSLALQAAGLQPERAAWYLALPVLVLLIALLNVGIMSVSVWLVTTARESFLLTIRKVTASSALTYIALPLVGYMIWALMQRPGAERLVVFLLYGPLLVYRASVQKQNRLDLWLRDSFIMQSRVVDKRDGQTFGHSQRVGELCEAVARMLHLSEDACTTIRTAGILHDLGKIAIPDSILLKPGKLTPEEYEIIKTHPVEGAQILAEHPEQKGVAEIVHHHHERWDGGGYPDALKGDQIPIGSRIVNACDAFDTITQARVFRPTVRTPAEAIRELRQLAGTWYDPTVISALERIVSERWGVVIDPVPQPVVEKPIQYRDVLGVRSFRRLWLGQAVSYFGDMMNTTGLAIMLYLVTRSPSLVAIGLIAKALPTILFGLVAGPVVDRLNRQRLMVGLDLARAVMTITIPFFALRWLPGVFIAVFLIAAASAFFNPAKQAIVPNLVPPRLLIKANSLVSSSEKSMELLGYAAAGVIAAAVSWLPLFLVDAATYLVSAVTLLAVRDTTRDARPRRLAVARDTMEGLRYIAANPVLSSTMALTGTATVFGGMILPIFVVLAYRTLHGGAWGYGFMEAAVGAGSILGALAVPAALNRFRAGSLIIFGVLGMGLMQALIGTTGWLWLVLGFLFVEGAANMMYYVPVVSVTQSEAPDHIRGRVMASRFLLVQAGLLTGMALSGPLTERIGAQQVFVLSGLAILAIAASAGLVFRSLRTASLGDELAIPALKATG